MTFLSGGMQPYAKRAIGSKPVDCCLQLYLGFRNPAKLVLEKPLVIVMLIIRVSKSSEAGFGKTFSYCYVNYYSYYYSSVAFFESLRLENRYFDRYEIWYIASSDIALPNCH